MDISQEHHVNYQAAPPKLLRPSEVVERCGLSRSSIYKLLREDKFPAPIKVTGHRGNAWIESEVTEWIYSRIAQSRAE